MFYGVDPIAEKFPHVSGYNYAENAPISNIDLWGLQAISVTKSGSGVRITVKPGDKSINWLHSEESKLGISPEDIAQLKYLQYIELNDDGSLSIPVPNNRQRLRGSEGEINVPNLADGPDNETSWDWSQYISGPFDIDASGAIRNKVSFEEILDKFVFGSNRFSGKEDYIGIFLKSSGDIDKDNIMKNDVLNEMYKCGFDTGKIKWLDKPLKESSSIEIRFIKENVSADEL